MNAIQRVMAEQESELAAAIERALRKMQADANVSAFEGAMREKDLIRGMNAMNFNESQKRLLDA